MIGSQTVPVAGALGAHPYAPSDNTIRFSDWLIVAVVLAKPAVDALHEHGVVKYAYMGLLMFAAFFAYVGRRVAGLPGLSQEQTRAYTRHVVLAACYTIFLFVSLVVYLGSLNEIFKIVSPFIVFVLVAPLVGTWFLRVLGVGALLIILTNAALLPIDAGWVYWGGVRTFKGYYFFKTDLAYAVSFATLSVALWQRFRFTPILILATGLAAVQVVLSNSRLNYLLFLAVAALIALKGGMRLATLLKAAVLVSLVALVAAYFFDSRRMLGFDFSDAGSFTQGRNQIWNILIEEGVMNYTFAEWLFGRGLQADLKLFAENTTTGDVHNAHNEMLHLLITEGLFGLALYGLLWLTMHQFATSGRLPAWSRGVSAFGCGLLALQSMTAVVSSYATKTWPLVFLLLAVAASSRMPRE